MTKRKFWLGVLHALVSLAWVVCLIGLVLIIIAVPTNDQTLFTEWALPCFFGGLISGLLNRWVLGRYHFV